MAKKTQRKVKPKARRPARNSFMVAWPNDLAALATAPGKGLRKDISGSRFVTTAMMPNKPASR